VARTVVRRAERLLVASPPAPDSLVGPYLNRLSDLLWTMARWQETEHLMARPDADPHPAEQEDQEDR
jgi:cob(I)alamin adenosyltransferase